MADTLNSKPSIYSVLPESLINSTRQHAHVYKKLTPDWGKKGRLSTEFCVVQNLWRHRYDPTRPFQRRDGRKYVINHEFCRSVVLPAVPYQLRNEYTSLHSQQVTSLVVWWSELLTTNHQVPGSIPGSTLCVFPWKGKTPMATTVWVVGRN